MWAFIVQPGPHLEDSFVHSHVRALCCFPFSFDSLSTLFICHWNHTTNTGLWWPSFFFQIHVTYFLSKALASLPFCQQLAYIIHSVSCYTLILEVIYCSDLWCLCSSKLLYTGHSFDYTELSSSNNSSHHDIFVSIVLYHCCMVGIA